MSNLCLANKKFSHADKLCSCPVWISGCGMLEVILANSSMNVLVFWSLLRLNKTRTMWALMEYFYRFALPLSLNHDSSPESSSPPEAAVVLHFYLLTSQTKQLILSCHHLLSDLFCMYLKCFCSWKEFLFRYLQKDVTEV